MPSSFFVRRLWDGVQRDIEESRVDIVAATCKNETVHMTTGGKPVAPRHLFVFDTTVYRPMQLPIVVVAVAIGIRQRYAIVVHYVVR